MQYPTSDRPTATAKTLSIRHKAPAAKALAGAALVILVATHWAASNRALALPQPPENPAPVDFASPPSFAAVAARVTPAVVNVAVIQSGPGLEHPGAQTPLFPQGAPFGELLPRGFRWESPLGREFENHRKSAGQGSGFIIDPQGHIVTNNHVIADASSLEVVLNDGTSYTARVKGRDSRTDLALLKIEANGPLPYVEFGDSDLAQVGDWVLAVGNPFGLGGSVSAGIISARGRDIQSGPYDDYLQIDAPINRGNSGGPLFDASGRVVGINTAIYSPSGGNVGIGFAIPATKAQGVIASLKAHGRVERGWLGVRIQAVSDGIAAALGRPNLQGALVAGVVTGGPADKAGLLPGDLILALDDDPVASAKDLSEMVAARAPGTRARISVERQGGERVLDLSLARAPAEEPIAENGFFRDRGR